MLQALEDSHGGARGTGSGAGRKEEDRDDASGFFSSHPLTRERIETLRRFDRTHGGSDAD